MWQRKFRERSVAPAYDVIEYVYDPSNRLLEEVIGDTGTVYDYDLNGNVIGKSIENSWHHIVEQSQIKKSGFRPEEIHNVNNVIAIDHAVHMKITGYYNPKDQG